MAIPNPRDLGQKDVTEDLSSCCSNSRVVIDKNSIMSLSAAATPLNLCTAAAVGGMNLEGVVSSKQNPDTSGRSQTVSTTLTAMMEIAKRGHAADLVRRCEESFVGDIEAEENRYVEMQDPDGFGLFLKVGASLHDGLDSMLAEGNPSVLLIITGGTICMDYAFKKVCLKPSRLSHKLAIMTELQDPGLPTFDILEWNHLVDSSDVGYKQWCLICNQVQKYYDNYDGFVILHGTDTMAYTASALSFMLENLDKPVVITGSVLPLMHISTDAKRNIGASLMVAGYSGLREVVVVFGSQVIRGTRVVKYNCSSLEAFASPNFPALGSVGIDMVLHDELRRKPSNCGFRIFTDMSPNVVVLTVTPTVPLDIFSCIFESKTRPLGVVLQLYGSGTAPSNPTFLNMIKGGIEKGINVVVMTQCRRGTANLLVYENGVWISSLGVISAKDMTLEACVTKLAYLMGKGGSPSRIKELMEVDLRGEVTAVPHKVESRHDALSYDEMTTGQAEFARNLLQKVACTQSTSNSRSSGAGE